MSMFLVFLAAIMVAVPIVYWWLMYYYIYSVLTSMGIRNA